MNSDQVRNIDLRKIAEFQEMSDGAQLTIGTTFGVTTVNLPLIVWDWSTMYVESKDVGGWDKEGAMWLAPDLRVNIMPVGTVRPEEKPFSE